MDWIEPDTGALFRVAAHKSVPSPKVLSGFEVSQLISRMCNIPVLSAVS